MSIANSRPLVRRPIYPREFRRKEFLAKYDLSTTAIAKAASVSWQSRACYDPILS
jgi:hypothetical protein